MLLSPVAPQFTRYESNIPASPASNSGTAVSNPAGAANTKNTTWTELIASTAFDAELVVLTLSGSNASGSDTSTLLDIGIGASSSESVLIPDLLAGYVAGGTSATGTRTYMFPLGIPAGSRISARTQSVRTTGSVTVLVELYGGPRNPAAWWHGSHVTAIGINTADSGAVSVTPGSAGAEGSVFSIGTTTERHRALVVGVQGVGLYTTSGYAYLDIGIDTSSTSWLIRDGFWFSVSAAEQVGAGYVPWFPIYADIPSGTVLVAGAESGTAANVFDVALYGIT